MEITLNQPDKRYCWNCIWLSYRNTPLSAECKQDFRCEFFKVPLESIETKCGCFVTAKKCEQCIALENENREVELSNESKH